MEMGEGEFCIEDTAVQEEGDCLGILQHVGLGFCEVCDYVGYLVLVGLGQDERLCASLHHEEVIFYLLTQL